MLNIFRFFRWFVFLTYIYIILYIITPVIAFGQAAQLNPATGQLYPEQQDPITRVVGLPYRTYTMTHTGGGTTTETITQTDICSMGPVGGEVAIPCSMGPLSTSWIPTLTQYAQGTLTNTNVLTKEVGTGNAITASSLTDNGTSVATTEYFTSANQINCSGCTFGTGTATATSTYILSSTAVTLTVPASIPAAQTIQVSSGLAISTGTATATGTSGTITNTVTISAPGYATTATLTNYATTATLTNFETTAGLTSTLTNYATTATLTNYETKAGLSGTAGYVPVYTGPYTMADSVIYQSGASIGIGTTSPGTNSSVGAIGLDVANSIRTGGYSIVNFGLSNGGGLIATSGTNNLFQMGFNAQAQYGGTLGQLSGSQFFVYNFQGDEYYWGFNNTGDNFWGPGNTNYSVRVQQPGVANVPISILGASGQTANLFNISANGGAVGGVLSVLANGNVTTHGTLTLGTAGSVGGALQLNGLASGSATIGVPSVAGSTTFTLPGSNGSSNQFLQTNGSGITTWATALPVAGSDTSTSTSTATLGGVKVGLGLTEATDGNISVAYGLSAGTALQGNTTPANIGAVPTSLTVCGQALTSSVTTATCESGVFGGLTAPDLPIYNGSNFSNSHLSDTSANIVTSESIVPTTNATYNLGSSLAYFENIYTYSINGFGLSASPAASTIPFSNLQGDLNYYAKGSLIQYVTASSDTAQIIPNSSGWTNITALTYTFTPTGSSLEADAEVIWEQADSEYSLSGCSLRILVGATQYGVSGSTSINSNNVLFVPSSSFTKTGIVPVAIGNPITIYVQGFAYSSLESCEAYPSSNAQELHIKVYY